MSDATDPKPRKHPDIFTPAEAAEYLHLDPVEGLRTLQTLRADDVLSGFRLGPTLMYHRRDLDNAADRIFAITPHVKTRAGKSPAAGVRPHMPKN